MGWGGEGEERRKGLVSPVRSVGSQSFASLSSYSEQKGPTFSMVPSLTYVFCSKGLFGWIVFSDGFTFGGRAWLGMGIAYVYFKIVASGIYAALY